MQCNEQIYLRLHRCWFHCNKQPIFSGFIQYMWAKNLGGKQKYLAMYCTSYRHCMALGLFLSQHWAYFQYILLQVLQNHLGTYERALIIPLLHVQPGFQVRRIKDDWQTFPKAITKACKTWVFCSVWQYNNFSITLKKPTYIRCSLKRSILITCCLVHQQCIPTSSKLGVFSTWCTLLLWGKLKMVDKPFEKRIRRDGRE